MLIIGSLVGCGNDEFPNKKPINLKEKYTVENNLNLGSLNKQGYLFEVEPESFEEPGELVMHVLSVDEAEAISDPEFEFYTHPLEFNFNDQENIRLSTPAMLTIQIPTIYLDDDFAAEELFFANYYDGQWEYVMPDAIDLKEKTASIEVNHFSFWGFGRPSEEKQIETFAHNLASLQWQRQKMKDNLRDALERQYADLFESIGVTDNTLRNQLTLDMIEYLENEIYDPDSPLSVYSPISSLAAMANAIEDGESGQAAFQAMLLEITGKGLFEIMEKDPGQFSMLAGVTGGLSKAAGSMMEGDTKAALEGIA